VKGWGGRRGAMSGANIGALLSWVCLIFLVSSLLLKEFCIV
jgi:hypothetical protein